MNSVQCCMRFKKGTVTKMNIVTRDRILRYLIDQYRGLPQLLLVSIMFSERRTKQIAERPRTNVYRAAAQVLREMVEKDEAESVDDKPIICPHCGEDERDGDQHGIGGYALVDYGWVDNSHCEPEPDYDAAWDSRADLPY